MYFLTRLDTPYPVAIVAASLVSYPERCRMSLADSTGEDLVPDDVIPHRLLPPLKYRDMPEPIPWQRMVGPSIILAGLALGSGEYILWPKIVHSTGFVFFWACLLGVVTQFFVNLEIERWTLVTGESAITGFCRLSRQWSWIFLILNVVPWAWPGWATGSAQIASWMMFGAERDAAGTVIAEAQYTSPIAIGLLLLSGVVLTAGPVVYNTVEKLQTYLVGMILVLVAIIGACIIRPDAVMALASGLANFGTMPELAGTGLTTTTLLGALAFAGAGGTMNLSQSNYIKDKGYGMGHYIGRITSPLTGNEEAISETGYHFRHTPENMSRWRTWWLAANFEHFCSFLMTCVVCLVFLSLISYSLFYDANGQMRPEGKAAGDGFRFVWAQGELLSQHSFGWFLKPAYLLAGMALLLTTELGVLDASSRISADIMKVNFLRDDDRWSVSRLYFFFLWGEIVLGSAILLFVTKEPLAQLQTAAAMNGTVMFLYSVLLLYLNAKILPRSLSITPLRFVAVIWSCAFFGYFTWQAGQSWIAMIARAFQASGAA